MAISLQGEGDPTWNAGLPPFWPPTWQLGNIRTQTLKAFPEAAYREIIASLV